MSYEPTVWKSGDIVTSAKLNKLEQGVAAGGSGVGFLKVSIDTEGTLDKTWQEIYDALSAGYFVSLIGTMGNDYVISYNVIECSIVGLTEISYGVTAISYDGNRKFKANSKTDYPVIVDE